MDQAFTDAWRAASSIDTALTKDEAWLLWEHAIRAPDAVVEIGAYKGASAILLGRAVGERGRVITVDPFDGRTGVGGTSFPPHLARDLRNTLRRMGADPVVTHWHMTSVDAAGQWRDHSEQPVTLLWIDGDHTVEGAADDWRAWTPLLAPGARVLLHDVTRFDGPARVVEQARREGWRVAGEAGTMVALAPPVAG